MKKNRRGYHLYKTMSLIRQSVKKAFLLASGFIFLVSCDSDDVGQNYFTFTGDRMGEYLEENPEQFSEFTKLLDTTQVIGMLNAYGYYTCFAPDNEAMQEFYKEKGYSSLADIPDSIQQKIAFDHIIEGNVILSEDFIEGRLAQQSMSNRYISITFKSFSEGNPVIKVNQTSPILQQDIEVHNGVIHAIGEVLKPTELTLVEAIAEDPKFTLFFDALFATGLHQQLQLVEDKSYNPDDYDYANDGVVRLGTLMLLPEERKYGYTALMVSDSTFKTRYGIETIDDLKAKAASIYDNVYPEDAGIADITNRRNSLNRFMAYHLINKNISYTRFIIDYDQNVFQSIQTYDMFEYIETMCPNTLMEVRTMRSTNETNLFNYNTTTGEYVSIVDDNYDNDALNGVYHEIDGILSYNRDVVSEISAKRLRMDVASFFPELTNNNMRGRAQTQADRRRFILPPGYVERLEISNETELQYFTPDDRVGDFQGDEIVSIVGLYDFVMTTLPIPAGTYEVRMGYQPNDNRGIAQLYWDGAPTGIPLDLSIEASDPEMGYELPGSNPSDPLGYENDKMMRNRGYMKGPSSFRIGGWYNGGNENLTARNSNNAVRRILGIYTFEEASTHTFGVSAAQPGQFVIDYLEFVPTELIEKEGVD